MNDHDPLISAFQDEAIDDASMQRLNDWVKADPHHADEFVRQVYLHRAMRDLLGGERRVNRPAPIHRGTWRRLKPVAIAAGIVLAIGVGMALLLSNAWDRHERLTNPPPPIAAVLDVRDVAWSSGQPRLRPGQQVSGSFVEIDSGVVEIEFFSGARVRIHGPAKFGLNSPMRGFLDHGRVLATVPRAARGFTIGAPGLAVVDLGTEFELTVDRSGAAELHVITGSVQLQTGDVRQVLGEGRGVQYRQGLITEALVRPGRVDPAKVTLSGDIRFHPGSANTLPLPGYRDSSAIWLMLEATDLMLGRSVEYAPAQAMVGSNSGEIIEQLAAPAAPGTRVHCYLLRFAPGGDRTAQQTRQATVKFPGRIVGLIAGDKRIRQPVADFLPKGPGYEGPLLNTADMTETISLEPDLRTLHLTCRAYPPSTDNLRVLVTAENIPDHPQP